MQRSSNRTGSDVAILGEARCGRSFGTLHIPPAVVVLSSMYVVFEVDVKLGCRFFFDSNCVNDAAEQSSQT